jgi:hypothetical protein
VARVTFQGNADMREAVSFQPSDRLQREECFWVTREAECHGIHYGLNWNLRSTEAPLFGIAPTSADQGGLAPCFKISISRYLDYARGYRQACP